VRASSGDAGFNRRGKGWPCQPAIPADDNLRVIGRCIRDRKAANRTPNAEGDIRGNRLNDRTANAGGSKFDHTSPMG
jgi:hypothetical protein